MNIFAALILSKRQKLTVITIDCTVVGGGGGGGLLYIASHSLPEQDDHEKKPEVKNPLTLSLLEIRK
jgi:hypothetical protein